jgi:hypothetical protein
LVIGLAGFMGSGTNNDASTDGVVVIPKDDLNIITEIASTTEKATSTDVAPVIKPVVKKAVEIAGPKAELFIMSYCPYGLQMQKAYLPVMELLGKKANIDIKFVDYIMHGEKEITENTRQYCIEKEQPDKYVSYVKCFTTSGQAETCLKNTAVDETKLAACVSNTDKTFKITESFKNKSTWVSGYYPLYNIYKDLNTKYGVQGSPTLVIDGAQVNVDRTPEAIKNAICAAFTTKPIECLTQLSNQGFEAGFGGDAGATQEATCN